MKRDASSPALPASHDKLTIASMAVIANGLATQFHEALGHGAVAWARGDVPTELTSNHLSTARADPWVQAGGTIVNLVVGTIALAASYRARDRANLRYFLWLLGALNLLPGAGYFLFSGVVGVGDWQAVIDGLPHQAALRVAMALFGAALYYASVRALAVAVKPFVAERSMYNAVGRWPYLVAALFSCAAGALDPMGVQLMILSTIPAAFGGLSGLLWADHLLPRGEPAPRLTVGRAPTWWAVGAVFAAAYIAILGPGIRFPHGPDP